MRNFLPMLAVEDSMVRAVLFLSLSLLHYDLNSALDSSHESANGPSSSSWLLDEVRKVNKRQAVQPWGGGASGGSGFCPPSCAPCDMKSCQLFRMRCIPSVVNCCCRPQMFDIKMSLAACDGEEAVAGCMNNLCGAGFYCSRGRFCCRCANGKSLGLCVNGLCPAGYTCNENNYCCAVGPGSVIGRCVNGKCPPGYTCGAGDLCYSSTSITSPTGWPPPVGGLNGNSILPNPFANFYATTPFPYARRMRPAGSVRTTRVGKKSTTEKEMKGAKKKGRGKKRQLEGPLNVQRRSLGGKGKLEAENAHSHGRQRHSNDDIPVLYDDYQAERMISSEEMRLIEGASAE